MAVQIVKGVRDPAAQVSGRAEFRLDDATSPPCALLRTQTRASPRNDLVGHRPPDDPATDPRAGSPATTRPLERPAWKGTELAAVLGIHNVNSFRVQLSQWSRQGHIHKIGPALYGSALTTA
ncbi:hypothetical protein ACFFV7_36080 [Nonomuraea spiralis]|uniref:Uncharacterized protein n=1 Tax=Nonomuraea spiralis TaxID=46182 RepID=A0ABV5IRX7_9ACTN|nr:hypothetical protein [Nonomuraea spiralis]